MSCLRAIVRALARGFLLVRFLLLQNNLTCSKHYYYLFAAERERPSAQNWLTLIHFKGEINMKNENLGILPEQACVLQARTILA